SHVREQRNLKCQRRKWSGRIRATTESKWQGSNPLSWKSFRQLCCRRQVSTPARRESDGSKAQQQERKRSGFRDGSGHNAFLDFVLVRVVISLTFTVFIPRFSGAPGRGNARIGVKVT